MFTLNKKVNIHFNPYLYIIFETLQSKMLFWECILVCRPMTPPWNNKSLNQSANYLLLFDQIIYIFMKIYINVYIVYIAVLEKKGASKLNILISVYEHVFVHVYRVKVCDT